MNAVSCKHAFTLAKSTEYSLLDFMSRDSNSSRSKNFEYSIFLGGMEKSEPLIFN